MNSPTQIQITLKPGQPLKVEVLNAQGSTCTKLTQALDKLGTSSTTLKPEYYQDSCVKTIQNSKLSIQN